ncbi:hypothetical protein [Antarcticirhabdus aurantiaca]|uniref:Uncharacterized protein n=1 Tax=Antarcticirhabdus aurantiaca TaxID=2606717 RepID=A0ACD4NW90_9HYPH|nr:hypothetical protein OXU80_12440 [Jeongeuplla avenae]
MSKMFATAGSILEIGPEMAFDGDDLVAADFTSSTWTEVGGTTDLGTAGDTAQLITSDQVARARTRKAKGTRNAGSMQVMCDLDYSDAGQLALIAAEKSPRSFAFRITFNDAPGGGTPSRRMFIAYVMSTAENLGGANSVQQLQATLEIDSNIVRVAAASA